MTPKTPSDLGSRLTGPDLTLPGAFQALWVQASEVGSYGKLVLERVCECFPLAPMYIPQGHSLPSRPNIKVYPTGV